MIIGLVLSLAAMVPVPLAACAALAGLPGDCPDPAQPSQCEQMPMAHSSRFATALSDRSCCRVTHAPLPEARAVAIAPAVTALPAVACELVKVIVCSAERPAAVSSPNLSPPKPQALLCIFLI